MNNLRRHALTAVTACLFVSQVFAAEYSLPLTDDAYIHGAYPTSKFGSSVSLNVHTYGPMYALVRFDPAAIAGQTITRATLTLYPRSILGPGNITVHPILSSWSEGTVTWALQPPSETTAAANFDVTTAMAGSRVTVEVTNVVQRWANGSLAHAGLLLKSPTAKKAYFDSKELSGGFAAALSVTTQDGVPDTSRAKLLDLSKSDACLIDEPGLYFLDRNWQAIGDSTQGDPIRCVGSSGEYSTTYLVITAAGVTIDFRGFRLLGEASNEVTMISVRANAVTLRDGSVSGGDDTAGQGVSLAAGGVVGTLLDGMRISNSASLGTESRVRASVINNTLRIGGHSLVIESEVHGVIQVFGDFSEVRDNRVSPGGVFGDSSISVNGFQNKVHQNSIRCQGCSQAIHLAGTGNRVAFNMMEDLAGTSDTAITISGAGNQIDSNTVFPNSFARCLVFAVGGNYFGGNRCPAASTSLGTALQTDWGGNVAY